MHNIVKGYPSTSQDNYQLSVTKIIEHAARNYGGQKIISRRYDGQLENYTYSDAFGRISRLANALKRMNISVGDRVGVLAWNTKEAYEIFFGLPGIGAVMLLLNFRLFEEQQQWILRHSKPKLLIVDESLIPTAEEVSKQDNYIEGYIIITRKEIKDIKTTLNPIYSYEDLLRGENDLVCWPNIDETSAYAHVIRLGLLAGQREYIFHIEMFI